MKLNLKQKQAVEHESGPLLIVAGAGTGKTTVITERIKYLIQNKNIDPYHIFAATFTQKAADEMLARLDQVMPLGYEEPWLGTFHSLSDRLLRQEGLEIGLNPDFKIMTTTDQWIFIKHHLYDFDLDYYRPLGNPNKFITALIKFFSRLNDEDVSLTEFQHLVNQKRDSAEDPDQKISASRLAELAKVFATYQALKRDEAVMDFGDLISLTLKLFRDRPNLLAKYQQQFSYVLVDEFQDTNYAQYQLIKLLAPPEKFPNLTVVGDDDQCLPSTAQIITSDGVKTINQIAVGDRVLSAVGKGYTSFVKVAKTFNSHKQARLLTITTKTGKQITLTDNHKVFCYIERLPKQKPYRYVYLMYQKHKGWRIGITNDLVSRLHLERHIDYIIAIKACKNEQEARYYETLYSLKYGIPTTVFSSRPHTAIVDKWLDKLLAEIDTQKAVERLSNDLHIDINSPHVFSDAIIRGNGHRIKINIYLVYRSYSSKTDHFGFMPHPSISHLVNLDTSDQDVINTLVRANIKFQKSKKGIRVRYSNQDLNKVIAFAEELSQLTGGFIDEQASIAKKDVQSLMSRIIPAKNILPGMFIPILKGKKLIYDQVTSVTEKTLDNITVYDLEVFPSHNYIADGVAIHNSVYKFRGASISNILDFRSDYPQTKSIVISENYRSTQAILDSAYQSIVRNNPDRLEIKLGINKKLASHTNHPGVENVIPPQIFEFTHLEAEVNWTIQQIIRLVTQENLTYKDIAILTRANSQLEPYASALKEAGLPFQVVTNRGLFDAPEISTLITFLKVLSNPEDSQTLFQLTQSSPFNIDSSLILTSLQQARASSSTLWSELQILDHPQAEFLINIVTKFQSQATTQSVSQLLYQFIDVTKYIKPFIETESIENQLKIKNLNLFFNQLKRFEQVNENKTLVGFLDVLDLWQEAGENPPEAQLEDIDTISLLTVHASKGLEYAAVFVGSLVAGRFPSSSRRDPIEMPVELIKETLPEGNEHVEEERRLFYVALTRAKYYLFLTYSPDVGGLRPRHPSGFLTETGLPISKIVEEPNLAPPTILPQQPVPHYLKQGQFVITTLSYSQIDTFKSCPLKYKYRYLLQIPTRPNHALSFGQTIHQTLYTFHEAELHGLKPTLEMLLKTYQQNFITAGYESTQHKQIQYDAGVKSLKNYFQSYPQNLGKPLFLEQNFRFKIDDTMIVGKIDRIDQTSEGDYEIVDYKTGSSRPQAKVDRDEQLSIYALAAQVALHLDIKKLALYFIMSDQKIDTLRTDKDLTKIQTTLSKQINQIKTSPYPAKPNPVKCGNCDFYNICPFAARKK
jgi:DNA helicase-2/ATP-dependent DNA helicase PcrA